MSLLLLQSLLLVLLLCCCRSDGFSVGPALVSYPCRRRVPVSSSWQPSSHRSTEHRMISSPTSTTQQRPRRRRANGTLGDSTFMACPRNIAVTAMFVQSRLEEIIDADDTVEILPYTHYLQELRNLASITSRDATAVDQAMEVVDRMFRAHIVTDDESIFPDTEIYNTLLNVHAFSSCRRHDVVTTMETIVARMEDESITTAPTPNADTYATLLDAYMQRQQYDRVQKWVAQIQTKQPHPYCASNDTIILNKLIQAHGRQGNSEAARQVLEDMLSSSDNDINNNNASVPNHKTWVQVMRAYAAQGDTDAVHELIDRMTAWQQQQDDKDDNWTTATATRNALLQAYAMQGNAAAAERVLYQMLESDNVSGQPDVRSLEYVLQAYHRQKPRPGVVFKVEQCLALRDALAKRQRTRDNNNDDSNNDATWKLSPFTLYTAVAAMQRDTQDPLKLVKAARLLRERQCETADAQAPPHVYRNLLNACARYKAPPSNDNKNADLATFQVAMDAFNQLVGQRDSRVYGQLLRTAGRLLPTKPNNTQQRDAIIGKIFDQCCAAGFVNEYVLEMLDKAASEQLLLRTLGGFLEDGVTVPEKWRRNVKETKTNKE